MMLAAQVLALLFVAGDNVQGLLVQRSPISVNQNSLCIRRRTQLLAAQRASLTLVPANLKSPLSIESISSVGTEIKRSMGNLKSILPSQFELSSVGTEIRRLMGNLKSTLPSQLSSVGTEIRRSMGELKSALPTQFELSKVGTEIGRSMGNLKSTLPSQLSSVGTEIRRAAGSLKSRLPILSLSAAGTEIHRSVESLKSILPIQSLSAVGLEIKRSTKVLLQSPVATELKRLIGIFMQLPSEKKLIIVAYPLTAILLYLLVSSNFVAVQYKRVSSWSSIFFKSFGKADQNVPNLSASLAMGKTEGEILAKKDSMESSRMLMSEKAARAITDAATVQAKKDIKSRLAFIVESEEKTKLLKVVSEIDTINVSASAVVAITVPIVNAVMSPVTVEAKIKMIAEIKEDVIAIQNTPFDIPSSSLMNMNMNTKNQEDAAVAMLFILVLGSPLLQVLHQYMTSA